MDDLTAYCVSHFPLDLEHKLDLIYLDGPLLSVFNDKDLGLHLCCWCDMDSLAHRWMVFRVSNGTLIDYLGGKVSLMDLVLNPIEGYHYLVDISEEAIHMGVYKLLPCDLPSDYIPEVDSYCDLSLLSPECLGLGVSSIKFLLGL